MAFKHIFSSNSSNLLLTRLRMEVSPNKIFRRAFSHDIANHDEHYDIVIFSQDFMIIITVQAAVSLSDPVPTLNNSKRNNRIVRTHKFFQLSSCCIEIKPYEAVAILLTFYFFLALISILVISY